MTSRLLERTGSSSAAGVDDHLGRRLSEWAAIASVPAEIFIGGDWRHVRRTRQFPVHDPATGDTLCHSADASETDCIAALAAAEHAAVGWATTAPRERARVLRRAAEGLLEESDRLALVLSLESGKPLPEAYEEVAFAAEYLEWNADEATRICGRLESHPSADHRILVARRPVGPCLVISPWNFPLALPARGVAPALAAGCTVVLRPSALTPLSARLLAQALAEAGLPGGCLNVVSSSAPAATDALITDPRLEKLTFTGSARVGAHLLSASASRALRVTAELGGNAPFLVFADADLDEAAEMAVAAKCRNAGQACTAANRFYVERSVAEEFTTRLAGRMAALRLGRGTEPGVDMGPMISAAAVRRLTLLVDDAIARGARVVLPGGAQEGEGHFFSPVVLADVPQASRVLREEIFGPVAPIATFDSDAEALALANDSAAGLAAYVMSGDLARAMRVAESLRVGMVGVNRGRVSSAAAPFGGVKCSGFGRSGGREGIDEYLETHYLTIPTADTR